jgi:hypothetical protein
MSAWRQHKADIPHRMSDFRFRGESGHQNRGSRLPLMTRNGHWTADLDEELPLLLPVKKDPVGLILRTGDRLRPKEPLAGVMACRGWAQAKPPGRGIRLFPAA